MSQQKRELMRQYRDTGPAVGIYVIRNLANQRVFVGGSMNVQGSINRERFELDLKSHRNAKLLQDWLQYGPENFTFEVIDVVKKREDPAFDYQGELAALLDMWREELNCYGETGYNTRDARPSR